MAEIRFLKINDIVGSHFVGNKDSLIILLHGLTGNRLQFPILELSYLLYKDRFSTFRFDFRGRGESFYPQDEFSFRTMIEDIETVLEYFSERYSKIYIVAKSISAVSILFLKFLPKNLKGVIFLGLPFNIHENVTKEDLDSINRKGYIYANGLFFGRELVNDYLTYGPKICDFVKRFDIKSLAIYGENDKYLKYARECLPTKYVNIKIIKEVGHSFYERENALQDLYKTIVEFIK